MVGCGLKKLAFFGCAVLMAQNAFSDDWYAKDALWGAHDPTVLRHEDGYALMSTNNMLLMMSSEDGLHWKNNSKLMTSIPSWLKTVTNNKVEDIWAPDLFYFGGKYRVYYTGSAFGKNTSGIGFLASTSIVPGSSGYSWSDNGEVVRSGSGNNYNAIDADVVEDASGNHWMVFGSWWDGIRLVRLDESSGKQSTSDKTVYKLASRGGSGIEGPSLIEHNGKYFLFTAWDVCCKMGNELSANTYKTAMGRADAITGPYVDRSGKALTNGGGTILLQRYGRYYGPGGGEAFKDLNRLRFVHHYYDSTRSGAPTLHIRDLVFTDDNWVEMGQPFLGRYLSAEAEHGALTNVQISRAASTSSNGEYVAYINYSDSKIRLPMNIPQAGEYLLRYRYANGGTEASSHKVTINGSAQTVKLPVTGAWGSFPEKSVVLIPAKLKRGGNFIEVSVGDNFAELDRIDFLRVVRDTLPGNGFDNGIKIRLNDKDELAMKNGGWALFENVVTDSIAGNQVRVQVKGCSGGTLTLHASTKGSKEISSCTIPSSCGDDSWTEVECSAISGQNGVKDFYLKVQNNSKELLVGNVSFKSQTTSIPQKQNMQTGFSVQKSGLEYIVRFNDPGERELRVMNSLGQTILKKKSAGSDVHITGLPEGKYIFQVNGSKEAR